MTKRSNFDIEVTINQFYFHADPSCIHLYHLLSNGINYRCYRMITREQNAIIVNVTILRHAVNENSCKK